MERVFSEISRVLFFLVKFPWIASSARVYPIQYLGPAYLFFTFYLKLHSSSQFPPK